MARRLTVSDCFLEEMRFLFNYSHRGIRPPSPRYRSVIDFMDNTLQHSVRATITRSQIPYSVLFHWYDTVPADVGFAVNPTERSIFEAATRPWGLFSCMQTCWTKWTASSYSFPISNTQANFILGPHKAAVIHSCASSFGLRVKPDKVSISVSTRSLYSSFCLFQWTVLWCRISIGTSASNVFRHVLS